MEVVFSAKQQDALISSCHCGILQSLKSRGMAGHFGRWDQSNILCIYYMYCVCILTDLNLSQMLKTNVLLPRDKTITALSQWYLMPKLKEQVQMFIKYCEPCQCNNTRKLENCPREMQLIKIKKKVWLQIGMHLT